MSPPGPGVGSSLLRRVRRVPRRVSSRNPNTVTDERPSAGGPTWTSASFTRFCDLPLEIQHAIWTLASFHEPPRFQFIAPYPAGYNLEDYEQSGVKLSIVSPIGRQQYPMPSILHTSQAVRNFGLKIYTLWPCVAPFSYCDQDKFIYVREAYDIFYFTDFKEFIGDTRDMNGPQHPMIENKALADKPALESQLKSVFSGIRHVAIDYLLWSTLIYPANSKPVIWSRYFGNVQTLTIVLPSEDLETSRHEETFAQAFETIQPTIPYTTRNDAAEFVFDLAELAISKDSHKRNIFIPTIDVLVAISAQSEAVELDENSRLDRVFWRTLKDTWEHRTGEYIPDKYDYMPVDEFSDYEESDLDDVEDEDDAEDSED